MSDHYDDMVNKILNIPELKEEVSNMLNNKNCLNLIDPDWKNTLIESSVYKNHKEKKVLYSRCSQQDKNFTVRKIINLEKQFHIMVAGQWYFECPNENLEKRNALICVYCPPLVEIGKVMAEYDHLTLADNGRFFIETCLPRGCYMCRPVLKNDGYIFGNDWCVRNTKLFDGKEVFFATKYQILKALGSGQFMGILNMRITGRITFGEKYKLTGKCMDMMLFKQNCLNPILPEYKLYRLQEEEEEEREYSISPQERPSITLPDPE